MFDVFRTPLVATIRCRDCQASLTVESDDQAAIEKSIKTYERGHRCRLASREGKREAA